MARPQLQFVPEGQEDTSRQMARPQLQFVPEGQEDTSEAELELCVTLRQRSSLFDSRTPREESPKGSPTSCPRGSKEASSPFQVQALESF